MLPYTTAAKAHAWHEVSCIPDTPQCNPPDTAHPVSTPLTTSPFFSRHAAYTGTLPGTVRHAALVPTVLVCRCGHRFCRSCAVNHAGHCNNQAATSHMVPSPSSPSKVQQAPGSMEVDSDGSRARRQLQLAQLHAMPPCALGTFEMMVGAAQRKCSKEALCPCAPLYPIFALPPPDFALTVCSLLILRTLPTHTHHCLALMPP